MGTGALDPLIHDPARLRIVAILAALPDGDVLSVTRLQDMIGLPPGSPMTGIRELGRGYVRTGKTGGDAAQTTVALTGDGRAALDGYTAVLRQLPGEHHQDPAPGLRVGDADRDAAAAALGEHFAQGRLTLDELSARLDATLTAVTHAELFQATSDLPELTVLTAQVSFSRGKRARPGHRPGPTPSQGAWPRRRGWTRGGSFWARTVSRRWDAGAPFHANDDSRAPHLPHGLLIRRRIQSIHQNPHRSPASANSPGKTQAAAAQSAASAL